jgi:hypothetical protein
VPAHSLDEVFQCAGNRKRDFSRRGSSGNWAEDQLTWKARQPMLRSRRQPTSDVFAATAGCFTGRADLQAPHGLRSRAGGDAVLRARRQPHDAAHVAAWGCVCRIMGVCMCSMCRRPHAALLPSQSPFAVCSCTSLSFAHAAPSCVTSCRARQHFAVCRNDVQGPAAVPRVALRRGAARHGSCCACDAPAALARRTRRGAR